MIEWLSSKRQRVTDVGEGIEKREPCTPLKFKLI
jgi:hypothetical protein